KRRTPILSPKQYKEYYKFTFIRNPWARAHSWYKNVMRDKYHRDALGIPEDCSFKQFLFDHPNQWALASQLCWLLDSRGNISFDFIGRFENLIEDFAKVCDDLGIKDKSLPKLLTNGKRTHYPDSYDDEMKDFVARLYKDEIKLFGFEFGE
ncbi:MAG: sulfotransferase family protein, partial [Leptolyngbya sp. SIO3F4]|nr:sulfotransferase family protein [Leptolyngbya sp. SIO3F4]